MTTHLLLLGTEGCHLCEEAQAIVATCLAGSAHDCNIQTVDIAEQNDWQTDYALKIPVLLAPEIPLELCWPFDSAQVSAFLRDINRYE